MDLPRIDMAEATRLTREGRLDEAMAVLRGQAPALRDGAPSGTIDLQPPGPGTGGAWTLPGGVPRGPAPMAGLNAGLGAGLGLNLGLGGGKAPQVAPGARFEERVHLGETGSRAYRLYVPAGHAGRALPLLVMLHGCTQDPLDFAAGTRMNEVAEEAGLMVAYPEQTRAANAQRCWNWFSAADQGRGRGEPALIAGLARDVLRDLGGDPSRVFVAGLSAGGAAAAVAAAAYPDLFAGLGVHSGLACGAARDLPSALAAMRQGGAPAQGAGVPTIVFHGDRDGTVHPVNGDEVAAQARGDVRLRATTEKGEAGGRRYSRTVQADAEGRVRAEQWVIHGAGHAWSGGSAEGSYADAAGPDASREMVRFFLGLS